MAASVTSGSHQRVRPEDILNIRFYIPNMDMAIRYPTEIYPYLLKIKRNSKQLNTLENIRNSLLPKLPNLCQVK